MRDADQGHLFGAKVRVLPNGNVNAAAARAFALNGFFPTEIRAYWIADNPLDGHLYATAEPGGETYRALTLTACASDRRDFDRIGVPDQVRRI
ncbi:MAG: hypothetical protein AAF317_10620 [Pseudomonadota bacterium]